MRAEPWQESRTTVSEPRGWDRWGRTVMTSASGLFLLIGAVTHVIANGWRAAFVGHEAAPLPIVVKLLYLGAIVTGAWFVAPKGWRALVRLRPDMNLLMMVAVAGSDPH